MQEGLFHPISLPRGRPKLFEVRNILNAAQGMETLEELFHETLRDIYYAEKKILKALPKMAKRASSRNLAAAYEAHLQETEPSRTLRKSI